KLFAVAAAAAAALCGAEPNAGIWHTWVISSVTDYKVPVPPSRGQSEQEARDLETLADQRTAAVSTLINFGNAGTPVYRWMMTTQTEVDHHGLSGPAATRAMSLVAAGLNDAIIAAWYSKYLYNRPRPPAIDKQLIAAIAAPDSPSYPS